MSSWEQGRGFNLGVMPAECMPACLVVSELLTAHNVSGHHGHACRRDSWGVLGAFGAPQLTWPVEITWLVDVRHMLGLLVPSLHQLLRSSLVWHYIVWC